MIDTALLRLTWSVIEDTHSPNLAELTDTGLVRLLLQRISKRVLLSGEEVCLLYDYVSSKTTLIRDMADSRFVYVSAIPIKEPPSIAAREDSKKVMSHH